MAAVYLEVAINAFKGQWPSQPAVYNMVGKVVVAFNQLSEWGRDDILGSTFFGGLVRPRD